MKTPMSNKSPPEMLDAIEHMFPGTRAAIKAKKCPLCNKPILKFTDALSVKEYEISGLCQQCQDEVFS